MSACQVGHEVEIQTERNEPFQARLDLSPASAGFLIADSVLNQFSTERTHRDSSALTRRSLAHRQRNHQMWEIWPWAGSCHSPTSSRFDHELPEVT